MTFIFESTKSEIVEMCRERIRKAELKKAEIDGEIRALNEMIDFLGTYETGEPSHRTRFHPRDVEVTDDMEDEEDGE